MFEKALRKHYRFPSTKGMLPVEDLWDLTEAQMDNTFKALKSQQKVASEDSLISSETKTIAETELDEKIEIVKYIFKVKKEEKEARAKAADIERERRRIIELIAQKKDAALGDSSIEELEKKLAALTQV